MAIFHAGTIVSAGTFKVWTIDHPSDLPVEQNLYITVKYIQLVLVFILVISDTQTWFGLETASPDLIYWVQLDKVVLAVGRSLKFRFLWAKGYFCPHYLSYPSLEDAIPPFYRAPP